MDHLPNEQEGKMCTRPTSQAGSEYRCSCCASPPSRRVRSGSLRRRSDRPRAPLGSSSSRRGVVRSIPGQSRSRRGVEGVGVGHQSFIRAEGVQIEAESCNAVEGCFEVGQRRVNLTRGGQRSGVGGSFLLLIDEEVGRSRSRRRSGRYRVAPRSLQSLLDRLDDVGSAPCAAVMMGRSRRCPSLSMRWNARWRHLKVVDVKLGLVGTSSIRRSVHEGVVVVAATAVAPVDQRRRRWRLRQLLLRGRRRRRRSGEGEGRGEEVVVAIHGCGCRNVELVVCRTQLQAGRVAAVKGTAASGVAVVVRGRRRSSRAEERAR